VQQCVIVGLSAFGMTVARRLTELGCQVLAIDSNQERVQTMRDTVTQAVVADATDKELLTTLGVRDADAVVVSLGDQIDRSILVTLALKEVGAKNVIVKGVSDDHRKVLELIGVNEVIFPERDMAVRVANRLSAPRIVDQIELGQGYSVIELAAPQPWVGKTLLELGVRAKYTVEVILVKKSARGRALPEIDVPRPDAVIEPDDMLVVVGNDDALDAIKKL